MRLHSLPLLALLALALVPGLAAAQEFPPAGEAGRLHLPEEVSDVGPILSVGVGWGGPWNLNFGDPSVFERFKAGRFLHGLGGIRIGSFGMAAIVRRGEPGVSAGYCARGAGGSCTASSAQNGGLLMFNSAGTLGSPVMNLGLGFWLDRSEVKWSNGNFARLDAWALLEYLSVEWRVGGPTSRFGLGGYGLLAMTGISREVVQGVAKSPTSSTMDSPIWAELGLRVSLY